MHHGASSSRSLELDLPSEVPPSEGRDLETELSHPPAAVEPHELPFGQRRSIFDKTVSAPEGEVDASANMTSGKAASVEAAEVFIARRYRAQQVEISNIECRQIATLAVEMGGSHAIEMCGPQRLHAEAPKWGLQAGFVVDVGEKKPYARSSGHSWNFDSSEDMKELEEMLDYEKTHLLIASPPCANPTLLRALSEEKGEIPTWKREMGLRQLYAAIRTYRRQHELGRCFMHEHPAGTVAENDPEMLALRKLVGVHTVYGPMCQWIVRGPEGHISKTVHKKLIWITNSKRLAKLLRQWDSHIPGADLSVEVSSDNGLAKPAVRYPPKLVAAMLKEIKEGLMEFGELTAAEAFAAGPNPSQDNWEEWSDETWEDVARFFDNVSGELLPTNKVLEARAEELKWCDKISLFTKVLREVSTSRGIKPVPTGWVDVNKGDKTKYNVRSRLVGKELKRKTKDQLLAHELFSPMPPWEMVKVLLGFMVTDGFDGIDPDDLVMGCFDISRAHFMAPAERELYIELPDEAKTPEDGDVVGRLNRMMYGFRDASNGWARDWQALLKDNRYKVGRANAALFYNREMKSRGGVHGDDFYVLGPRASIDEMNRILGSKYSLRESYRLGFGPEDDRTASILNRVVTLSWDDDGRKQVTIEPDARHVEIILRALGLGGKDAKPVATPGIKKTDAQEGRRVLEPPLGRADTTLFRSCLMRASFLAQDRADLPEAVKCLAQQMSAPSRSSMEELKHLARYLKGKPSMALVLRQQRMPNNIRVSVDSDFAADRKTRRSTTGMVQRLGMHCVKATSNLQASSGLNVGETEYYALVHGAVHGLGLQSYLEDWGIRLDLVIESDSTSAASFASRQGLGKQRHVQTRYLWVQERIARREFEIKKVAGGLNVSDILTKSCPGVLLQRHMEKIGQVEVEPSKLHKAV